MRTHPWYTAYHGNLLEERNQLYRRYRLSKLDTELYEYRIARDFPHEQIENVRLPYYWNRLRNLTDL